jgi:APA family basic amino acid/polyamine antiporter
MGKTKVLVALRDMQSAESLVMLACQISSGMEAELTALHVAEIPMATPIDAADEVLDRPGREILDHARKYATEHFSRAIATKLLRARQAGEALVGEAAEQRIDTLVVGYHQPHTLGEILLGSTAQYVIRHAPCRVIVQIPPPQHR